MKKIYLIIVLVLASMMVVAEPSYKFMRGHSTRCVSSKTSAQQMIGHMGSVYEQHHAGIKIDGPSYDGLNMTAPSGRIGRSIVTSDVNIIGGSDVMTGSLMTTGLGSRRGGLNGGNSGTTGGTASVINPFTTADGVTLGLHGKKATIGNELVEIDPNGSYNGEPTHDNFSPIGDALVPLLMMIMAFAGFVYFRKK